MSSAVASLNRRNCTKMTASSTIVPSEPMSHGRFVRMYSRSREWKRICEGKMSVWLGEQVSATYASAIGQVSEKRKEEEEEREAFA
jgi:hypothetical protein